MLVLGWGAFENLQKCIFAPENKKYIYFFFQFKIIYLWECKCLNVKNGDGYGDKCKNHDPSDATPYCYVNKDACAAKNITVFNSTSTIINTNIIGYSYKICGNKTN